MNNITEEMIDNYAEKLLIGLIDDERKMILEEFDSIEKNMDLINQIPNIKDIEPLSYPFEMYIEDLRDDDKEAEEIEIDVLLRNCDRREGREVEVPKVVA